MSNDRRNIACALNIDALIAADCFFDALGNLVLVLDDKGMIRLFNSGAEDILGYKSEEVMGKSWIDIFVPKELQKTIHEVFNDIVAGNTKFLEQYDNEVIKKNGQRISLRWHTSAIRNSKGSIEGIVSSAVDISMIIESEQRLKDKIEELESLNKYMVSRELKMMELKSENKRLTEEVADLELKKNNADTK